MRKNHWNFLNAIYFYNGKDNCAGVIRDWRYVYHLQGGWRVDHFKNNILDSRTKVADFDSGVELAKRLISDGRPTKP